MKRRKFITSSVRAMMTKSWGRVGKYFLLTPSLSLSTFSAVSSTCWTFIVKVINIHYKANALIPSHYAEMQKGRRYSILNHIFKHLSNKEVTFWGHRDPGMLASGKTDRWKFSHYQSWNCLMFSKPISDIRSSTVERNSHELGAMMLNLYSKQYLLWPSDATAWPDLQSVSMLSLRELFFSETYEPIIFYSWS